MKKLLTLLCLGLTFSAMAQHGGNLTPMEQLQKKINRLQHMWQNGRLQALVPEEVQQLNQMLKSAIGIIRNANGGGHGGAGITVQGYYENISHPIAFQGQNPGQVFNDCVYKMDNVNIGNVDLIYTVVNGNPVEKSYKSSGYWTTTDQFCTIIEQKAAKLGGVTPYYQHLNIQAKIENQPLSFSANTLGEAWLGCVQNLQHFNNADEIFLSVNGSRRERYYKSSGYWNGVFTICHVLTNKIPEHL